MGIGGARPPPGLTVSPGLYNDGVASLSEYGRSAGGVHSLGYHVVGCPKCRKRVLVGAVADRLRGLLAEKAHDGLVDRGA